MAKQPHLNTFRGVYQMRGNHTVTCLKANYRIKGKIPELPGRKEDRFRTEFTIAQYNKYSSGEISRLDWISFRSRCVKWNKWNGFFVVALLFYVDGKHLRSCRDGQLT